MTIRFSAERQVWSDSIALRIADITENKFAVAREIVFSEAQPNAITSPAIHLTQGEAQELANQLYAAGIHPEQAAGSAGQLGAVKYHLEDMRRLVFKGEQG